jgi:DNA-binding GntR family transcriptional regulator
MALRSGTEAPDGNSFVRTSLREQIKDVILQRIVRSEYEPGVRLVETRIAQELGVSQASVREALRDLEHLGCVVHEPYRGCSVRTFSIGELLEAFPVRAALEELGARQAAEGMDDRALDELELQFETMLRAARRGDAHDFALADADFHGTIMRGAQNATLLRHWRSLEPYLRTYITVSRPDTDLAALCEQHRPVLEALRMRDPERAAKAVLGHLAQAAELLRASAPELETAA